jgi:hypothetical protein
MSIENWFKSSIIKGLQGLLMLRLQGAPADDTIESLAQAWIAVLSSMPHTWQQDRDQPRIQRAFLTIAANSDRWPAPKNFIEALPPILQNLKLNPPRDYSVPPEARAWLDKFKSKRTGEDATPNPETPPRLD